MPTCDLHGEYSVFCSECDLETLARYSPGLPGEPPSLDHKFYIKGGVDFLDKAIRDLEVSAEKSGNLLMRAIINNLKFQRELLTSEHQLY